MNHLSREKQIEIIAALCEGVGIRTAARLTGVNRGTAGSLGITVMGWTAPVDSGFTRKMFHRAGAGDLLLFIR